MKTALALLILIAACNKPSSDASPSASTSAAAAPAAAKTASVTIDGKPLPATHAMIQKVAAGNLQLYVGDDESACAEFQAHSFLHGKRTLFDLGPVANGVAPVTDVWHGAPDSADPGSTVTLHGDPSTASKVDVDFAVTCKAAKLDAKGSLSATVCK